MNHLNSLLIEGVVAQNPEAKTTNGGGQLVVFTIVSHRYTKPREREGEAWSDEAIFLDVLAWGSLGGKCMDLVEKGMTVRIVGRFRLSSYTNREGAVRTRASVIAQHIEFRRRRSSSQELEAGEEEFALNADSREEMPPVSEPLVIYEY